MPVEQNAQTKVCSKCGVDKPLSEFYKKSGGLHGVHAACKECLKAKIADTQKKKEDKFKAAKKKIEDLPKPPPNKIRKPHNAVEHHTAHHGMAAKINDPKFRVELLSHVINGNTLNEIAAIYETSIHTVRRWLACDQTMVEQYAAAKVASAEALIEKALEISFDESRDFYIDEDGRRKDSAVSVSRDKLKISQLNKLAGIRNAEYSDKGPGVNINVGGGMDQNGNHFGFMIYAAPTDDLEEKGITQVLSSGYTPFERGQLIVPAQPDIIDITNEEEE